MIRVLSLGAGVQSTCVLLMSCRGVLPKLDAAVFADTGAEPKSVYKHLAWLETEARCYGIPILKGKRGDLRADTIEFRRTGGRASGNPGAKRWASLPLYIKNPDGTVGKVNRQCTKEYKIEVVVRIIRRELLGLKPRQVAPAMAVEHWFGISADEVYRVRSSTNHWQVFRYPLIMDVNSPRQRGLFAHGYDRQDCLDWLQEQGYPTPPRSACTFCPFHSDEEWLRMRREDPEAWADAVAFDHEIRAASAALMADGTKLKGRQVGLPYLHRSCVPLDQVVFRGDPGSWSEECRGVCGV